MAHPDTNTGGGGSSSGRAKIWVGSHPADHLQLIPALGEGKVLGWRFNISPSTGCLCQRNGSCRELRSIASVQENRTASQKDVRNPQVQIPEKFWCCGVPASLALGANKDFWLAQETEFCVHRFVSKLWRAEM